MSDQPKVRIYTRDCKIFPRYWVSVEDSLDRLVIGEGDTRHQAYKAAYRRALRITKELEKRLARAGASDE